jgi:hypothetical protein
MVESLDSNNKPIRGLGGGESPDSGMNLNGVRRAFSPTVVGGVLLKRGCGDVGLTDSKLSQYFKQNLDSYRGSTEADS